MPEPNSKGSETKLTVDNKSPRLVVFLVSSIRSSSEPWRSLPDSAALGQPDFVFVRFKLGSWSVAKPLSSIVEHLRYVCLDYWMKYPNSEYAFLAWGSGGVAVKKLLINQQGEAWIRRLRLVVFVGTPGRKSQSFFERFLRLTKDLNFVTSPLYSGFDLDELGYKWEGFVRASRSTKVVYFIGSYDIVAPFSSVDQWDSRNVFVIPEDHASLTTGATIEKPDSLLRKMLSGFLLEQLQGPQGAQ